MKNVRTWHFTTFFPWWKKIGIVLKKKKTDGDLHICIDYKIGAYYKICSDSYPIPNICGLPVLDGINFFVNIDHLSPNPNL